MICDTFQIPVIFISNIYFAGLHPDLCYIGGLGRRVDGPLGDYHSKISLLAYIAGKSAECALELYCKDTYDRMGFYHEYQESLDEMERRDRYVDVPVFDLFSDSLRREYCMFSVNHPTPYLFNKYAEKILIFLHTKGIDTSSGLPYEATLCTETLANNAIFPIYPEIAMAHNVLHLGSYRFKPVGTMIKSLCLSQFIEMEYAAFSVSSREELAATSTGRDVIKYL